MCLQNMIDESVDAAVDEHFFDRALRYRWVSHANSNATIEPDTIAVMMQKAKFGFLEDDMDQKVFVRRLWIDTYDEREKIRKMLNGLGFYVLTVPDGLEVNAIRSTPDGLVEWFKGLFGKE